MLVFVCCFFPVRLRAMRVIESLNLKKISKTIKSTPMATE